MEAEGQWAAAATTAASLLTMWGLRVLGALAILIAGWIVSHVVYRAVVRLCARSPRIDRTVALFLGNGARYVTLVFTFVAVLTTFGIATTSFVAVLGALGIAVGLALQGTLSNLAAGIMLVVFRPFRIGDRIETANVAGTTREINLFFTEIDSDDNTRIIIPNGKLWGEITRVPTRNDSTRLDFRMTRPADDDTNATIERLRAALEGHPHVMRIEDIGIDSLGDASHTLVARVWVARAGTDAARFEINRSIKEAFATRPDSPQVEPGTG